MDTTWDRVERLEKENKRLREELAEANADWRRQNKARKRAVRQTKRQRARRKALKAAIHEMYEAAGHVGSMDLPQVVGRVARRALADDATPPEEKP